jgi:hypothetical protein
MQGVRHVEFDQQPVDDEAGGTGGVIEGGGHGDPAWGRGVDASRRGLGLAAPAS